AEAWRRHGARLLERIEGRFALAVVDGKGEGLVATDRHGAVPVCWAEEGGALRFATRADALARACGAALDPQALLHYLHFHVVPAPGTVFRGVRRLLPGHCLRIAEGRVRAGAWWTPRFGTHAARVPATREELFGRLRAAVRGALEGAAAPGAFLSGGTDSSAVAGIAAAIHGEGFPAFSIGFDAPGYDELGYARAAARHFGLEHHTHYLTPEEVAEAVPRIARHFDQPFGNASVVAAWRCAELARAAGVDRLLAGDGGDELFGGNARYRRQQALALYGRLPRPLRAALIDPLARPQGPGPLRKLARYVEQARRDPVERLEDYNLLRRLGPARVLHPELLEAVDTGRPLALRAEAFHGALADDDLDRMLAMDLRFTLADDDLQKVGGACGLAGVDVAFPMLDGAVVAFACALPPRLKATPWRLRPFYKRAMRGFLPRRILAKRKHGFGLPFGIWLTRHEGLRRLAFESLEALEARRIVAPGFLRELTRERVAEHPAYYGVMVWVLMMLSQWLEAHEAPGGASG
ncbi:MAG TPA: asparagine synthase, partial [Chromatiales bacterium]|nr:asparagine synthase [Chromatiales bacterium]